MLQIYDYTKAIKNQNFCNCRSLTLQKPSSFITKALAFHQKNISDRCVQSIRPIFKSFNTKNMFRVQSFTTIKTTTINICWN